jgi:hypothetical protein
VHRPEIWLLRIQGQRAQRILERLHLRFSNDDGFFVTRDLGFSLDDVDRRNRSNLNAALIIPE